MFKGTYGYQKMLEHQVAYCSKNIQEPEAQEIILILARQALNYIIPGNKMCVLHQYARYLNVRLANHPTRDIVTVCDAAGIEHSDIEALRIHNADKAQRFKNFLRFKQSARQGRLGAL